jgi:signal transduction histidine kinase
MTATRAVPTWLRVAARVYAIAIGAVAFVVGVVALLAHVSSPPPDPASVQRELDALADVLDDANARDAEIARLASRDIFVTLAPDDVDADRQPRSISRSISPPISPHSCPSGDVVNDVFGGPPRSDANRDALVVSLASPSGHTYRAIVAPPSGQGRKLALLIAVVLVLLAGASLPVASMFARPLREIGRGLDDFGAGDLDVAVDLARTGAFSDIGARFNEMASRIRSLRASERTLLANVSHELRTPLARIRVGLELLDEAKPDRGATWLQSMAGDVLELERLVDDILTAARLDHASTETVLRLAPTSLHEILAAAAARFRDAHPRHELALQLAPALPTWDVDPVLLRRAFDNFLDNAGKYSEPGSLVELAAELEDGAVVVTVRDHGVGIALEDQSRLFTPFFRADASRTRGAGGVGLGLALAQRILLAHDGDVRVASDGQSGTTIRVHLAAR